MEFICPIVLICSMAIASKGRIQRMGVQKRQRIIKPAARQARVTCSMQNSLLQVHRSQLCSMLSESGQQ